jgi:RNA polymerase sigma-54 factor
LLQAQLKGGANKAALFLLDGHFDFLNPPQGKKILEKIQGFLAEREKLSFAKETFAHLKGLKLSDVEEALAFIKTLDPIPARDFSQESTNFIFPDIYIEKLVGESSDLKEEVDYVNRIVHVNANLSLKVKISDKGIPCVRLSPDFAKAQGSKEFSKAVLDAKNLLEALEYRESSMAKAACAIAKWQADFFDKGPGHLLPLKMQDIAERIGVHESTVSRMASSKFIQCQWGLFPVKYFFSSAVSDTSKDNVQRQIQEILEENSEKRMSDQKVCDALAQRGIKVARRTVAKYRAQMNITSSYER